MDETNNLCISMPYILLSGGVGTKQKLQQQFLAKIGENDVAT